MGLMYKGDKFVNWSVELTTRCTHIAETLYCPATSRAASTSHFKKLTLAYCLDNASKTGAIMWHGPHLCGTHQGTGWYPQLGLGRTRLRGSR